MAMLIFDKDQSGLDRRNLSSLVVDYIKEKILLGEYAEGDRILEYEVAEQLKISRAPVREAIRELEHQGLIKSIPRKGNFVVRFTLEDIKEIFTIRLGIENSVLEILIDENKLGDEDFKILNEMIVEMAKIGKQKGSMGQRIIKLNKKDMEFHRFLWEKSGSKRRVKILTDLMFQLQMAMIIDTKLTGDLEKTAVDHYEIVKFLQEKDLDNCKRALREHIISTRGFATIQPVPGSN